jgi:predicted tellurium resistance membrane protein TerC
VLGIDNIVFISLLTGKLPIEQQRKGRVLGLGLALVVRILLLISISWIMTLTTNLFNVSEWVGISTGTWHEHLGISGRDLILICGGMFLIYKSNKEIHESLEGSKRQEDRKPLSLTQTVLLIGLLDIVFGLDSVITAVGMADHLEVMIAAVVVAMFFMLIASRGVGNFINKHPSVKLLALAFCCSLVFPSLQKKLINQYLKVLFISQWHCLFLSSSSF